MKITRHTKFALSTVMAAMALSGCSLVSKEANGNEFAAQSCSQDAMPATISSKIVSLGLDTRTSQDVTSDEINARIELDLSRSILSAQAAAENSYWQPLADAWALEEALARAILDSQIETSLDATGAVVASRANFEKFISNVNTDFAAATKDTYCRIAFVKLNIPITYEQKTK